MELLIFILTSTYVRAFYGSIVYNFVLFVISKGKSDKIGKPFDHKKYALENWDNWSLATLCAPILVWYLPDIIGLLNSKLGWQLEVYAVYYLAAGPAAELLIYWTMKLVGLKDSLVTTAHE